MNENSPETDTNIFDCSIQHPVLLKLILLLWLAEEQKGCKEGLKWALASTWVHSPDRLHSCVSGPNWISKSPLIKYIQGIARKERRKIKHAREKKKFIQWCTQGERSEILGGGGGVGEALTGKMWQCVCAHWRTHLGSKPQLPSVSRAKSQLLREGDAYLLASGF